MRAINLALHLLIGRVIQAQSAADALTNRLSTCPNGYTPSLSCEEPPLVDNDCACACRNGFKFNQSYADIPNSIYKPLDFEEVRQIVGKPCTADILRPWTKIKLPHKKNTLEPSDVYSVTVDHAEDSIVLVADSDARCQHFEVYIDGKSVGETTGDGPLDSSPCGDGVECMEKHGGSFGHFTLPKGEHTIGMKWIKLTEACASIQIGVGSFQIYRPC